MAKDLTVILQNRPGTLADAGEALGREGINIEGACGFPAGNEGILHVLVEDAERARQALERAGLEVRDERDVVVTRIEDRPGAGGELLRRIADAGINVDLVYLTVDGQAVIGADDVERARELIGAGSGATVQ